MIEQLRLRKQWSDLGALSGYESRRPAAEKIDRVYLNDAFVDKSVQHGEKGSFLSLIDFPQVSAYLLPDEVENDFKSIDMSNISVLLPVRQHAQGDSLQLKRSEV